MNFCVGSYAAAQIHVDEESDVQLKKRIPIPVQPTKLNNHDDRKSVLESMPENSVTARVWTTVTRPAKSTMGNLWCASPASSGAPKESFVASKIDVQQPATTLNSSTDSQQLSRLQTTFKGNSSLLRSRRRFLGTVISKDESTQAPSINKRVENIPNFEESNHSFSLLVDASENTLFSSGSMAVDNPSLSASEALKIIQRTISSRSLQTSADPHSSILQRGVLGKKSKPPFPEKLQSHAKPLALSTDYSPPSPSANERNPSNLYSPQQTASVRHLNTPARPPILSPNGTTCPRSPAEDRGDTVFEGIDDPATA
jgi:hypothetical protein